MPWTLSKSCTSLTARFIQIERWFVGFIRSLMLVGCFSYVRSFSFCFARNYPVKWFSIIKGFWSRNLPLMLCFHDFAMVPTARIDIPTNSRQRWCSRFNKQSISPENRFRISSSSPDHCKQRLTTEMMNALKQDLEKACELYSLKHKLWPQCWLRGKQC